ncbi:MAG: hypothetical protein ACRC4W_04715 [Treponemataceae bacterium]
MNYDKNHPALQSKDYWQEQLDKNKILLYEVQTAIQDLLLDKIQEYTLDTGQSRQTVKKTDVAVLQNYLKYLTKTIYDLEKLTSNSSCFKRIIPIW